MNPLSLEFLAHYWSAREVAINLLIFVNLFGALLLGLVVGYERSYHGRAAGMRTYGLVCMASCAVTVIAGYPSYWYGGGALGSMTAYLPPDPTRIIQGILTGIGFLGAGVIMKGGLSISGLTTAASIWASSAIGILVGLGFYAAAILLALISAALMMWAAKLEKWLPSHPAVGIMLRFRPGFIPQREVLARVADASGYALAPGSFQIAQANGRQEWRCIAVARTGKVVSIASIAEDLGCIDGVEDFHVEHARN